MANLLNLPVGSVADAEDLLAGLIGANNAVLPQVNLFDDAHTVPWDSDSDVLKPVEKLDVAELVSEYQAIMKVVQGSLQAEYDAGRITGADYSKTFLALTQAGLASAVQFALGKDQAFWMAAKTQAEAITAMNQNELTRIQAMVGRVSFALESLKLASEDATFGQAQYQLTNTLPAQLALVNEQKEAQRAQTLDTRSDAVSRVDGVDNTQLVGLLGAQKGLYKQQRQSYIDDTRIKATKIFSDLWVTQKTIDDTTNPLATFLTTDVAVIPWVTNSTPNIGALVSIAGGNVYRFIGSPQPGTTASTVAPSGTSANPFTGADHITWLYVGVSATPHQDNYDSLFAKAKSLATT